MTHDIPLFSRDAEHGHTWELRKDRLRFLRRLARERADIVRARFFDRYLIFVNSPELLHEVMVEKAKAFEKPMAIRIAFFPMAGQGLTTSEGELWRRQRKLMAPLFQPAQVARYVGPMAECTRMHAETWRDGQVIDLARENPEITMRIAGKTLFDAETMDSGGEVGAAFTTALDWINLRLNSPALIAQLLLIDGLGWLRSRLATLPTKAGSGPLSRLLDEKSAKLADQLLSPFALPTEADRKNRRAIETLERRVQQMIDERRAAGLEGPDLLTRILRARDADDGRQMTDRQVRDEVLTLFIAGHEGISNGLAWGLYLLLTHPEVLRRVQAEVDALGGRSPSAEDLGRLPYTLQAVKEALRLYPSSYMFGKQAIEDVVIGGYAVPRGTNVFLSPFALHRRADLWPDPERFDPDRFTPEAEAARSRYAYIPFGGGPRICIGSQFALMEGQTVLAALLSLMSFALEPGQQIYPEANTTLRPNGIRVRVARRASATVARPIATAL
jgi:cytochrome P450